MNELFYSLQGEGARAGSANVFVRFSACNLRCDVEPGELSPGGFACDTEFASGRQMTAGEIVAEALNLAGPGVGVIFTGGEPTLQLDQDLADAFRQEFSPLCIETNGTADVSDLRLDWVTLSPKVAEHAVKVKAAKEVKYVRAYGQGIPRPSCSVLHKFISPAFEGGVLPDRTLRWCIDLVKKNPEWRLSVQQHQLWRVR